MITYDGEINVSYDYVAEYDAVISYNIEDIYLNKYRTELFLYNMMNKTNRRT